MNACPRRAVLGVDQRRRNHRVVASSRWLDLKGPMLLCFGQVLLAQLHVALAGQGRQRCRQRTTATRPINKTPPSGTVCKLNSSGSRIGKVAAEAHKWLEDGPPQRCRQFAKDACRGTANSRKPRWKGLTTHTIDSIHIDPLRQDVKATEVGTQTGNPGRCWDHGGNGDNMAA